jgi:hypothetical protein
MTSIHGLRNAILARMARACWLRWSEPTTMACERSPPGKARPKNGAPRRCEPAMERSAPINPRLVVRLCTHSTSPLRNSHPNGNHSGVAQSSCRLWMVIVSRSLSRGLAKTGRGFDFLRHTSVFLGFSRARMPSPSRASPERSALRGAHVLYTHGLVDMARLAANELEVIGATETPLLPQEQQ